MGTHFSPDCIMLVHGFIQQLRDILSCIWIVVCHISEPFLRSIGSTQRGVQVPAEAVLQAVHHSACL